jgi:hypothetical protein
MKNSGSILKVVVGGVVLCALAAVGLVGYYGLGGAQSPLGGVFGYDDPMRHRVIEPAMIGYREVGHIDTGFKLACSIAAAGDEIYVAGDRAVKMFQPSGVLKGERPIAEGPPQCIGLSTSKELLIGLKNKVLLPDGHVIELDARANVTSLAANDEQVFVADSGNRVVWRYDRSGKLLGAIGKADADKGTSGFVIPSPHFDLAIAPDGLLRIANPGCRRVEAYTLDGDAEFHWGRASMAVDGFSGCCNPAAIAMLPDGRIVTAEKGELAMVKIFKPDGQDSGLFDCVVAGPEEFKELRAHLNVAMDIAVDGQGRILVLDPTSCRVRIFARKAAAATDGATTR